MTDTRLEQLATAFPNDIERIRVLRMDIEKDAARNPAVALCEAFFWARTMEGHTYWRDLADSTGFEWRSGGHE